MTSSNPSVIFLTGAPDARTLNWEEGSLSSEFVPALLRYMGEGHGTSLIDAFTQSSSFAAPNWRHITLQREHLHTGISSPLGNFGIGGSEAAQDDAAPLQAGLQDTSTYPNVPADDTEILYSEFLEQSFALHNSTRSSQLTGTPDGATTDITLTSFLTTSDIDGSTSLLDDTINSPTTPFRGQQIQLPSRLANLTDLPSASHLMHIAPQTMTVNLVVGIISISAPRLVHVRPLAQKRTMEIIELLVGDETAAGFSVSFWLQPLESQMSNRRGGGGGDPIRGMLEKLRVQDVVLIRDVALSAFRGKVYGQSLNRRITRNETRVEVLSRADDREGVVLEDVKQGEARLPQLEKVMRVREWTLSFVGPSAGPVRTKRKAGRHEDDGKRRAFRANEELPPDTPF